MKKYILLLILTLFSINIFSQEINQKDIIGTWKVVKIEKAPTIPQFKPLLDSFKSAKFLFDKDKKFHLTTKNNNQLFSMMTQMMKNTNWRYNFEKQIIQIGSDKDNYTVMEIKVKNNNQEVIFDLGEGAQLPLILKVIKE